MNAPTLFKAAARFNNMTDGLTEEKARQLARFIYAAAKANTPGEYREMLEDDPIGIEALFCADVAKLFSAPVRRVAPMEHLLERNPLFKRVTDKETRLDLVGLDGCEEDEARWQEALRKHEVNQQRKRMQLDEE
jgi:hypothetical protein